MKKLVLSLIAGLFINSLAIAQLRSYDQKGLNVFESRISDTAKYDGLKLKVGAGFTQSYQFLEHENTATPSANTTLTKIVPGFNTANANMYFDVLLADGVTLNLTLYLSSRHHNETWVKGGYIQFDKLPFLKSQIADNIMKYVSLKVGHMEVNYGDAHFRRSDNGNSIYNPFIENYVMDGFATEIGGEVDAHYNGLLGVFGITNGAIKGDISEYANTNAIDSSRNIKHNPALIGKLGFDKQLNDAVRLRVTGSAYYTAGSIKNTLYGGDRGGSHYFGVMEKEISTAAAFSGRYNPGFTDKISSLMGNLFLKVKGIEWFSTIETSKGRTTKEADERKATQLATDLVFRFGHDEQFWLGGRYNTVKAEVAGQSDVTINRYAISGGWYVTKNIMAKMEYVNQEFKDFAATDIRNGGLFKGVVVEAVVGF